MFEKYIPIFVASITLVEASITWQSSQEILTAQGTSNTKMTVDADENASFGSAQAGNHGGGSGNFLHSKNKLCPNSKPFR
ncbi:MAG: hypothetical protein P0S94_01965 [Simkaniaceae bacterium]|nr:hypothetical protein [Simkaniaceae bacterium]